ncbi:hypothetical protein yrohd0001_30970 [Yersinia rohdei ATCC 43380]|nr:hypothetical protein yrohd0001_30970 [Yersinia rohdei ATCC 43380]
MLLAMLFAALLPNKNKHPAPTPTIVFVIKKRYFLTPLRIKDGFFKQRLFAN